MNTYKPKLSHAIFTSLLSILFAYLWAVSQTDRIEKAMMFGMILFLAISLSVVFMAAEQSHYYSVTAYIEALVKMDSDLRNQLSFSVPALRLVAKRGRIQTLFADTRATKEHIHLFLQDSTRNETASKRNWKTAERPAWAWQEIYDYLLDRRMVGEYATGADSYPWIGSAYQNLCVYFLSHDVQNLSAVYASET